MPINVISLMRWTFSHVSGEWWAPQKGGREAARPSYLLADAERSEGARLMCVVKDDLATS